MTAPSVKALTWGTVIAALCSALLLAAADGAMPGTDETPTARPGASASARVGSRSALAPALLRPARSSGASSH